MKYIFALPLILFPYTLLLGLYCLYSGFLMESVFGNNGYLLLFALFLCAVAAFCFTLPLCLVSLAKRADGRGMALLNMVVKLCHIPAYIAIFFLSLLFLISIWGIVFVVVFALYDFAAIGMSGAVGAVAACRCAAEGKIGKRGRPAGKFQKCGGEIRGGYDGAARIDIKSPVRMHRLEPQRHVQRIEIALRKETIGQSCVFLPRPGGARGRARRRSIGCDAACPGNI